MQKSKNFKRIVITLCVGVIALLIILALLILNQVSRNVNISQKDAEAIVLEAYGGYIVESEVDYDDFRVTYEITVQTSHHELEVTVDGNTGEIIAIDD